MSTLESQKSDQDYSTTENFLTSYYLYLLFIYVSGAALISGVIILVVYRVSHKEKQKMVKKMLQIMQGFSIFGIADAFIIIAWAYRTYYYAKCLGEILCSIVLYFVRDSHWFRWISILINIYMMVIQVIFMVWIIQDIYCEMNDACNPEKSSFTMYLMYSQCAIAFILESTGIILTTNMMMSLGWFYNEQFPPQFNLEQYHIVRPDKSSTILDMFPHPVNYQF